MKLYHSSAAIVMGTLLAISFAHADDKLELVKKSAFLAFDADQNGTATAKEIVDGFFALYAATDNDDSGSVSLDEFKVLSLGLAPVAESSGKLTSYEASRAVIFKRWDINADGKLTEREFAGGGMLEVLDSAKFGLSLDEFSKTVFIAEMTDSLK